MVPAGRLSVCCLTAERPAMVAAAMTVVREVADEIVVAVDERVDPATLGPLLDVADTVVRFEFIDPPERSRPWLVGLCTHPMVLMLDGDEVASAELVAALPALVGDGLVEQARLARRWCFPTERWWLAERPWWPDFQRRLLRRGPGLDFDVQFHGGVRPQPAERIVDAPIYHLVDVFRPLSMRRARSQQYERARPGMVAVGGGRLNDVLYAPEHFATRALALTPPEDVAALRRVLFAPQVIRPRAIQVPVVGAAEIAAHIRPGPLDDMPPAVGLRIVERDLRCDPGADVAVLVEITNDSDRALPRRDERGVGLRVATRTVAADGPVGGWAHSALPCDVAAGSRRLVDAYLRAPATSGRYVLEVALRNERGPEPDAVTSAPFDVTTRWGRYAMEDAPALSRCTS